MNWFKMLPSASLRALLQPGRWLSKGTRREPEPRQEKDTRRQMKKGQIDFLQNQSVPFMLVTSVRTFFGLLSKKASETQKGYLAGSVPAR